MSDRESFLRLEHELSAVRAASRRDRIVFGVVTAVIGAAIIGGAGQPSQITEEIRTKKLTVVDSNGKARAVIEVGEHGAGLDINNEKGEGRAFIYVSNSGEPSLSVTDGKQRASLKVSKEISSLILTDARGKLRGTFGVSEADGPCLYLADSTASPRLMMLLTRDNDGAISYKGTENQAVFSLVARADGSGELSFEDGSEKERLRVGLDAKGTPGILLSDAASNPRAVLAAKEGGRTYLDMWDSQGKRRIGVGVQDDQPQYAIFDSEQNFRGTFGMLKNPKEPLKAATDCSIFIFNEKKELVWKAPGVN